jgi:hypothetical protein
MYVSVGGGYFGVGSPTEWLPTGECGRSQEEHCVTFPSCS